MSQDQHTTEQGPGKPLSAPVSASDPGVGASRRPDPENGAQTGAESFELRQGIADAVDNAWRKSLETHAFGPRARAEITDAVLAVVQPELDRLDRIRDAARLHRQQLINTSELYAVIEAMDATAATGATEPFIDRPFRSHRTSEPALDAGPTVREAAADDRLWPLQKHGE